MDALKDLRYAVRKLARTPLFTIVAALTLAVGIGANTAVFSVVHGVLLKPLPFAEPERLVGVRHTAPGLGWDEIPQAPALYLTYREEAEVFTDTGMWGYAQVAVTGLEEPEQVQAIRVTEDVFRVLGVPPQLGRPFTAEEDSPGTQETVILSHAYWRERLGGDPGVLGSTLTVDGRPREVIGVMGPDFHFLDEDPALYLPFRLDRREVFFGNFSYFGIARLAPGVTLEQANAEVARMIPMAMESFPMPPGYSREHLEAARLGPRLRPLKEEVVGDVGSVLWVLFGTVGMVLLIACANVANLFLVRAEGRQQEIAVRSALGASRGRITRELLAESGLLGLAGGIVGLGLAALGIELLVAMAARLPRLDEIAVEPPVLLFTLGISALAALLFSAFPALRLGAGRFVEALKEGGWGGTAGRRRQRARNGLVVGQIAAALVLLVGSGLMIRSFRALREVHPGFERPGEVLTLRVSIPETEAADAAEVARLHEAILHRLEAIPGVAAAGMSSSITMDRWWNNDPIFVEELPTEGGEVPPLRYTKWIGPGYFETMGNPLLAGRPITWADVHDRSRVAVVTRAFARAYWEQPAEAVGKRIRASPGAPWYEIVGVVGDVRDNGVDEEPTEVVYWHLMATDVWGEELFIPRSMGYVLRGERVGTPGFLDEVRSAVWSVNAGLPLANVRTLDEILRRSMARTSFTLVMLAIAAVTALLLGAVGTYGVTAYVVSRRTREIGVRMALGARPRDVSGLVLRHGVLLAAAGAAVGLVAAALLTRLMSALLYGVSPLDPLTFGAVGAAVVAIALAASWLPARRAAAMNPVETLRAG